MVIHKVGLGREGGWERRRQGRRKRERERGREGGKH